MYRFVRRGMGMNKDHLRGAEVKREGGYHVGHNLSSDSRAVDRCNAAILRACSLEEVEDPIERLNDQALVPLGLKEAHPT